MNDPAGAEVRTGPAVHVADEQDDVPLQPERWARLAADVLTAEGVDVPDAELGLTFVDEARMAELNGEHMSEPGPTDVLSFPLDLPGDAAVEGPLLLGDVVVCPAVAARQASEHGVSVDDELALLVVHGVLHVLGWDHADPAEEAAMQARQRELLEGRQSP